MTHPRVLMVYHSCINKADPHGVSIRNWFAEWPKESLAQVYSGNEVGEERFCGRTFRLGPHERRFGRLFFLLKGSALGVASGSIAPASSENPMHAGTGLLAKLKWYFSSLLVGSGIWELIFKPIISDRMSEWIQDFKPDVIYAQGYSLSFAWLAVHLHHRFNFPICYHAVDDWPEFLYVNTPASWYVRPFVIEASKELLQSSSVRFAIGERMANEYRSRYSLAIEPLMICDSLQRFKNATPRFLVNNGCISILYSGGLAHYRWKSLVDLSMAANLLAEEGFDIRITVFTPSIPREAAEVLRGLANVQFEAQPSHEELPGILKGADILFLPETFDPPEANVIRFSVSTKAPLYMMSERPILVYGSPATGAVDYAKRLGWGYVVERQDLDLLADAIRRLHSDVVLRQNLVTTALEAARQNHESSVVRKRLLAGLLRATGTESPHGRFT